MMLVPTEQKQHRHKVLKRAEMGLLPKAHRCFLTELPSLLEVCQLHSNCEVPPNFVLQLHMMVPYALGTGTEDARAR